MGVIIRKNTLGLKISFEKFIPDFREVGTS